MDLRTGWAPLARYLELRSRPIMILILGGALAMAALRIVDYAFMPPDDALRHAATAVSGRSYVDVLVFDEAIPRVDSTPGWHRLLRAVLHVPGMDKYGLVSFSVFTLFLAFTLSGLLLLHRPEAWAGALLLAVVLDPGHAMRLALGRPFMLISMATVVFVLSWDRLVRNHRDSRAIMGCVVAATIATWLHSTWFLLLAVPLAAVFSGALRPLATLTAAVVLGVVLGATLTLQPFEHLTYPLIHTWRTLGATPAPFRVTELRPFSGASGWVLIALTLLTARFSMAELRSIRLRHPAFLTAAFAWVLGFTAARFWVDIGLPALLAGVALIIQRLLDVHVPRRSVGRWVITISVALSLYLAITANHGRRWESSPLRSVVYFTEHPDQVAEWLPEPGGVLYCIDMTVFYTMYFTYPDGAWKYVLGLEQAIMPREDLEILHGIVDRQNWDAFEPWFRKLRPQDRLFVTIPPGAERPAWEGVEVFDVPRSYSIIRTVRGRGGPEGTTASATSTASEHDTIPE